jgi:quercetin dioxygenase-like cupin family protein
MRHRRLTLAVGTAIALVAGIGGAHDLLAQAPPGFKRVELQKHDLGVPGREAIMMRGEFKPGAAVPRHTHPGEEIGFVLQGEVTLEVQGKPATTLKAGDVFFVPAGQIHAARNAGKADAVVVSTYVLEKGKPLATPVK